MSNLVSLLIAAAVGAAPNYMRRLTSTLDYSGFAGHTYPAGPGWTNAQVQRMAKKRRNKARHKAACKGK